MKSFKCVQTNLKLLTFLMVTFELDLPDKLTVDLLDRLRVEFDLPLQISQPGSHSSLQPLIIIWSLPEETMFDNV